MVREDGLVSENVEGYHITSELGSNAFSPTFLGEHISPMSVYQRVVIKLLYTTRVHTWQEQQDILQKIAVLQQLQHAHILPILSIGFHKERPYIITEYLATGSLQDRLQYRTAEQPLKQEDAFLTLAQVGQALQYAHQRGVVHGYLKPRNVLFNIRNEALVTGFHRHALQLPDGVDTDSSDAPPYQAPEQLTGHTTAKSDQYALASLAYTLLTGHRAFMVPSIHTPGAYYKTKALIAPARLKADLPSHIEEAILKAMSRDPDQRYDDIATFLAALKLPPAAGDKAIRETLVTLAELMQQDDPNLPDTPVTKSNIHAAITMQMSGKTPIIQNTDLTTPTPDAPPVQPDPTPQIAQLDFPDFASMPTHTVRAEPLTFPDALFPNESNALLNEADQATLKIPQPHAVTSNSRLQTVAKRLRSRPQRTIAILVCLLIAIIVFATTLINLNVPSPSKKAGNSPSPQGTTLVNSSSSPSASSPIVTRSSTTPASGVTIPPQNTTATGSTPTTAVPTHTPTQVPTQVPTKVPPPAPTQVLVPLTALFNNNAFGNAPGQANFDGNNFSYPSSQLPASGQITIQGVPCQFLNNGSGTNDNIVAFGQSISVPTGNYRQAFLLVAASWGPVTTNVIIQYTDGSRGRQNVTVQDWYRGGGVLNTTYRYTPNSIDQHAVSIYPLSITLDPARTIQALVFSQFQSGPSNNGRIHVFTVTLLT